MKRAGLIGTGLLGSALAERFIGAGIAVTAFDTDPERLEAVVRGGARAAASAREAASAGEWVVLCLPDSTISSAVLDDIGEVLNGGAIVIDTTTGDPSEMEAAGGRVARYMDAAIAGSSQQVRNGRAVVMAGGDASDFQACGELFGSFAAQSFHVGGRGSGARMKLVVNLVLGLNRAALAEGLTFAGAVGVDLPLALEVLRGGPAASGALEQKGAKMIHREWSPEARLRQHHKDVRLILKEGERHGVDLPLSAVHERLLEAAEAGGFGEADNSAILEAFRKR